MSRSFIYQSFFKENKLASLSLVTFLIRLLGIVFQFGAILLLTNFATIELVGKFNYIGYIVIIVGALNLLGLNTSFFQFAGKLKSENKFWYLGKIYYKSLAIIGVSYGLIVFIYLGLSEFLQLEFILKNKSLINYSLIGVLPFSIMTLNVQVIRASGKLFVSELYRSIFRFGLLLLMIALIVVFNWFQHLLLFYVLSFYFISIVTTVYIVFFTIENIRRMESTVYGWSYSKILKISVPMSLSSMSLLLMQSMDTIILKIYSSFETIALYSTAMKVSILINVILMAINTVIAPKVSNLFFSSKIIELKKLIQNSVNLNFIISFPVIVFFVFFSKTILSFFGNEYITASETMIIIMLGQMINSFCGPVGTYLNMTGKQLVFRNILALSLLMNLGLNFLLIPNYGMNGAAISMSISLAFWNILGCFVIWKRDGIILFPKFNFLKR